jgi:hypothetical protein
VEANKVCSVEYTYLLGKAQNTARDLFQIVIVEDENKPPQQAPRQVGEIDSVSFPMKVKFEFCDAGLLQVVGGGSVKGASIECYVADRCWQRANLQRKALRSDLKAT